ncbi:5914_t:CDS:2, partial [Entrophospora sp. SA101]
EYRERNLISHNQCGKCGTVSDKQLKKFNEKFKENFSWKRLSKEHDELIDNLRCYAKWILDKISLCVRTINKRVITNLVGEWTCKNVLNHYKENDSQLTLKQALDSINKDLKRISKYDSDAKCREKAESIIVNWKDGNDGPVDRIRDDNNDNGISDDGGDNYLNHLTLSEIRKYQKTTKLLLHKLPFSRVTSI